MNIALDKWNTWLRLFLHIAILACVAAPSSLSAQTALLESRELASIRLQLRWHHQFQFAGYYAAKEKGFYEREGFDVDIVAGSPGNQPVTEVLSGRAQYAEGNSEVLLARLNGEPLIALAAIFQKSPSVLITMRDSGLKAPGDLIGKRVMSVKGGSDTEFIAMFKREKIPLDAINFIDSTYNIQDLISGKTDAFNAYASNEPYFLKERGYAYNIIRPRDFGVNFYSDILFTSEKELREHPERVERFKQASIEGWIYALENPEEIVQLIRSKYNTEKTVEHLRFEARSTAELILPSLIEVGYINRWRFLDMANIFIDQGLATTTEYFDGFIYQSKYRSDKGLNDSLVAVVIFLVLIIAVFSVAVFLNRRQKFEIAGGEQSEDLLQFTYGMLSESGFKRRLVEELLRAERYGDVFSIMLVGRDSQTEKTGSESAVSQSAERGDGINFSVVNILLEESRDSDFIGRHGTEEFVLLLPRTTVLQAAAYAHRLCGIVSKESMKTSRDESNAATVSIGVAEWLQGDVDEKTVGRAEKALLQAKAMGGNQVFTWEQ